MREPYSYEDGQGEGCSMIKVSREGCLTGEGLPEGAATPWNAFCFIICYMPHADICCNICVLRCMLPICVCMCVSMYVYIYIYMVYNLTSLSVLIKK